ncbi:MAG: NUDIX domain-containing protein [Candidatus Gracilibacteria bacterium]|nr:NUDIX domain-containing protein [Candidatus Gracilibacteria bacterium]
MEKINIIREVSCLILFNKKGEILVQDRKNISKLGEMWGFFGGGLKKGETPEKALIREIMEELNIDLTTEEYNYDFMFQKDNIWSEIKIIRVNYFGVIVDKKIEDFCVLEGDKANFFNIEELFSKYLIGREKQKEAIKEIFKKIKIFYNKKMSGK